MKRGSWTISVKPLNLPDGFTSGGYDLPLERLLFSPNVPMSLFILENTTLYATHAFASKNSVRNLSRFI